MSINWPVAEHPAPSLLALPAGAASLDEADAAIELWEHYKGRKLDDGQRLDVALMMATRSDGLWAAGVTGHEKPRQSGKGDSVEVVEFWGLTQRCERILHTIHDAVLLATETQSRMLSLFDHPDLRRLKSREWKGTGQQMIEMRNGGIIWYRTRTGAGGRGLDEVDRLVIDEAQHAEQEHLNSVTATQAVSANPQVNVLGTGALDGKSAWWWSLRKQAKLAQRSPGAFGWLGYSAQQWDLDDGGRVTLHDVDPSNRDLWWSTIPGLVAGRVSIDFLEREFSLLGPAGFAQEYLCVWAPPVDLSAMHNDLPSLWPKCADPSAEIAGRVVFGLDVALDGVSASIGVAGYAADYEVVECAYSQPGTGWVVAQVVETLGRHPGSVLVVDPKGPAGELVAALEQASVPLYKVSIAEAVQSCGSFVTAVRDDKLRHRGQRELTAAVNGARRRDVGDAWMWGRKHSNVDVSPLVAVSLARWALGALTQLDASRPVFAF